MLAPIYEKASRASTKTTTNRRGRAGSCPFAASPAKRPRRLGREAERSAYARRGHPQACRAGAEGEKMREARLQELEGMAAALLATARQLPPGQDRHNALREVGRFRAQIGALKDADKAKK